ncbi:polysaccharide lyase family 7 protein [Streptomyces sp. NPDC096132]|uniref:polysaccharide lyase family 7 protein n=1 Tax=Streptomyces sp. NPDC096132 TaxID=3366075 RepID=UPI0037F81673
MPLNRRKLLSGTAATGLGLAGWSLAAPAARAAPIGTGWTEVNPGFTLHQPPDRTRYEYLSSTGEHHFWLYSTDPSTFPGQDSGPRSEMRWKNDYTSGQAQFECDMRIAAGAHRVCVMQIFGAQTQATTFMTLAMNTNSINYYDYAAQQIYSPVYDTIIRLNVVHETDTGNVHVFVNRAFRATFKGHGPATHYFKCGLYGREGMSARSDIYLKNIHLYRK